MSKGKERYIKNTIRYLKLTTDEFKLISQSNKVFPNVIEEIIHFEFYLFIFVIKFVIISYHNLDYLFFDIL